MMKYGLKKNHIEKIQSVFAYYPAIDKAIFIWVKSKGKFQNWF